MVSERDETIQKTLPEALRTENGVQLHLNTNSSNTEQNKLRKAEDSTSMDNTQQSQCFQKKSSKLNSKCEASVHAGEKQFWCETCLKNFLTESTLTNYFRTHAGGKSYICDVCEKGFGSSSNLNTHKRIHTSEKPYMCNACKKKFTSSTQLNRHKCTHTGEKPYGCNPCKKSFKRNAYWKKQKRTHLE